ncbi:elongation factor P-like protein YeiP [Salinispirillum sp. LH 10-3-1]|uniref:Elongation factor P-like protein n=1 Tax=Salinispirillum sp. LH 10-3-1 TaxID=2952525 RepID=A0AB38YIK5_9GAMM
MAKASELKVGFVVAVNGGQYQVRNIDIKAPSARGASTLYKVTFNHLITGQKWDHTYKGDDMLPDVEAMNKSVQFLYRDGDFFTFMDIEDYSQHQMSADELDETADWLHDGMEGLVGLFVEEKLVSIQLPQSVEKEIIETSPAMKGASATARTKPAKLAGGVVIQVPEYVAQGDIVKVNTGTRKFMGRA